MRRITKNKRAATEWTMAKLISLILGVILLVLIIYGFTTKGFGPLKDRTIGAVNEVLIMLNLKEAPPTAYDCSYRFLADIPGGNDFVKNLSLPEDAKNTFKFKLCKWSCEVWWLEGMPGEEKYRLGNEDVANSIGFDRWAEKYWDYEEIDQEIWYIPWTWGEEPLLVLRGERKGWLNYNEVLQGEGIESAKNYQEIYSSLFEQLPANEVLELRNFYRSAKTDVLSFYADSKLYLNWQDGTWTFYNPDEKTSWQTKDTNEAIDNFLREAEGFLDNDDLYFKVTDFSWNSGFDAEGFNGKSINEFSASTKDGIKKINCDDGEPYSDSEKASLKEITRLKIAELKAKTKPSIQEVDKIKNITKDKLIKINGFDYSLDLLTSINLANGQKRELDFPMIVIYNGTQRYGLNFVEERIGEKIESNYLSHTVSPQGGGLSFKYYYLNDLPVALFKINGDGSISLIGKQEDYKLKDEDFKIFERGRVIRDYLYNVCPR